MKLSVWAKKNGITYKTAWEWFKHGKLPVSAIKTPSGTILVTEDQNMSLPLKVVIYCRVSNHSRKEELNYQVSRCEEFCLAKGLSINAVFKEIASGLNDERRVFWKAIDAKPSILVVENKDRLTRFGFNYLERLLKERGCEILVINREKEDEKDLLKDMVSVLYSFCARLYGMRRAYKKVKACEGVLNDTKL